MPPLPSTPNNPQVNTRQLCSDEYLDLMMGYLFPSGPRGRSLSRLGYPYHTFPAYLSGGAYLMSRPVLELLRETARFVPRVSVEDIYVGMVQCQCLSYMLQLQ